MRRTLMRMVVLVPLLGCASTDDSFMANATDMEREVAIKEEFHRAASEALRESNAVLDQDAADDLRLLWQLAARRLVEDGGSRAEINRAVANVGRIVMAAAGRSVPGAGIRRQVTLDGVEHAKIAICPLYPFC